jgi:tRNA-dihydrouridine synthase
MAGPDRRISVAPMMDWTDEVYFGLLLSDLAESKNACRLYVASKN